MLYGIMMILLILAILWFIGAAIAKTNEEEEEIMKCRLCGQPVIDDEFVSELGYELCEECYNEAKDFEELPVIQETVIRYRS